MEERDGAPILEELIAAHDPRGYRRALGEDRGGPALSTAFDWVRAAGSPESTDVRRSPSSSGRRPGDENKIAGADAAGKGDAARARFRERPARQFDGRWKTYRPI